MNNMIDLFSQSNEDDVRSLKSWHNSDKEIDFNDGQRSLAYGSLIMFQRTVTRITLIIYMYSSMMMDRIMSMGSMIMDNLMLRTAQ